MDKNINTDVVIIGSGPGGAMLALLLVKLGRNVVLLERSATHKREFRGESISPDSIAILEEHNIMPYIEKHGYLETKKMQVFDNQKCILNIEFDKFDYLKKYSVDIPQPILLSALIKEAECYSNFTYLTKTKFENVIKENQKICGVICKQENTTITIRSNLVVGADGRYGKARKSVGLDAKITPLKRDVLWFMVTKPDGWGDIAKICINKDNHIIALPTYPDKLRVGFNIKSGSYKHVVQNDISFLHNIVAMLEPSLSETIKQDIKSWVDTSLLDIFTMEVPVKACDGFILIGDAAHTLTPILGQGVNQAIKDATFLAPVINAALDIENKIIPKNIFNDFINFRNQEIKRIHKFQMKQEKLIAIKSPILIMLRRMLYKTMNKSLFLQKLLWENLLYTYQKTQYKHLESYKVKSYEH